MAYFQLQPSVWDLVKEHVPESELLEIRAVLGESLIDMYTEIYTEVETLEQIWLKVQRSSRQEPPPPAPRAPLSDPPAVKELLKAELQLLLQALRERAAAQGRDGDATLSRYSPRVVSYALGGGGADGQTAPPRRPCVPGGAQSRPASSLSQSGGRPCSRASSSSSSCEDEVEAMRHQLNISYIDEVVSRLKSVLTEECEALKQDVRFLQEQVETAFERQRNWEVPEPTVIELKEERKRIQRDLNLPRMLSCPVPGEGPRGRVSQHDPRQIRSAVQRPIHSVSGSPQRERAMPPSGTRPPSPSPAPRPPPAAHVGGPLSDRTRARGVPSAAEPEATTESVSHSLPGVSSRPPSPGIQGPLPLNPGPAETPHDPPVWDPSRDLPPRCRGAGRNHHPDPAWIRLRTDAITGPVLHQRLESGGLLPAPPTTQKPANRQQSISRRLGRPLGDRLLGQS